MHRNIAGLRFALDIQENYRERVLTPEALAFLVSLQEKFGERRRMLLQNREERQKKLEAGENYGFLPETAGIRAADWTVAPAPQDLLDRRVEITGPTDAKMVINALNSGAKVFMADFEDALSPTWDNLLQGQINLQDAFRGVLRFQSEEGKIYQLKPKAERATLVVRPRGWHLTEDHLSWQGAALSASLFDFGLNFFHNAKERIAAGSAPYYYLPKMESHLEARLWHDVFAFAEQSLQIPQGSIRATCLIETLPAAFEMDEILYELRPYAAGLNAGRWDYIFSFIKKQGKQLDKVLPDRSQITMSVPFMRSYAQLLVKTCHRRGAHAMGGMAAFIPSRKDPEINRIAWQKVEEDKNLEAQAGFDGTWVAHPDLVPVAQKAFDQVLGARPHQKHKLREDVVANEQALLQPNIPQGTISEEGFRLNIRVAIQYINSWLQGLGAVAIANLMEDAATAEISRAQLWQWLYHGVTLSSGIKATPNLYKQWREEELQKLGGIDKDRHAEVIELLDSLVLSPVCADFLTLPAYQRLLDRRIRAALP